MHRPRPGSHRHPRDGDRRPLREVVAVFPVYRSYVDDTGIATDADRRDIDWALAQARKAAPDLDPTVFDFVQKPREGIIDLCGLPW